MAQSIGKSTTIRTAILFAILLPATLSFSHRVYAEDISATVVQEARHQRDRAQGEIRKLVSGADIRLSPQVDLSILKGVDGGFRYTYEVQPAFQAGLYTRVDRWTPKLAFRLPHGFAAIDPGAELIYLRQFKDQATALKSLPLFDTHKIPLNADNALALNPGDVVMLPVHLDLLVGAQGSAFSGPLEVYGRESYILRGLYQIQALRLADQRVRLRLVATRQRGLDGVIGARLGLQLFELNPVNQVIQGIFGKDLGSITFGQGPNGLVMADYIFDLSNAQAREAYNDLLSSNHLLTNFKLVDPFVGKQELQNKFVADLTGVDQIAAADAKLPIEQRRITQIFKGRSTGRLTTVGVNASLLRLLTFQHKTTLSQDTHIVFLDSNNAQQNFLAPVDERDNKLQWLFGLFSDETIRRASVITPADDSGRPLKMGEYVISLEIKDKQMSKRKTQQVLQNLHRNIAPSVISQLGITPLLTATSYKNARVFAQIIFNEKALQNLEGVTSPDLVEAFNKHLRTIRTELTGDSPDEIEDWVQAHRGSVEKISRALAASFDPQQSPVSRIRTFMKLQRDGFFRDVGTGFLMSLLPQDSLDQFLSVYVRVDATAFKAPVEASFGTSEYRSLVKATEYIEHLLNQGAFDLRLETFGMVTAASGQVVSLSDLGSSGSSTATAR